jgi:(1->4)-alpha-D-glucan 1-alpha-D-glucosylmutase
LTPHATYRVQFHRGFTFDSALAIVPYLAKLGISHVYASPILTARAGSVHGYDVIDPSQINPELGGEDAFRRFRAKLVETGLKLIVDIVPNHMAVGGADNAWWLDVLENGRASAFAHYFDIDWNVADPQLQNKVLAPFLGAPYAEEVRNGKIALTYDETLQKLAFAYYQHRFPLRPIDYAAFGDGNRPDPERLAEVNRPESLHRLLEVQNFRLCWWRTAGDSINWRRFFDINGLAALRVEDAEVFEQVHAKIFALAGEGLIDGLRVDHVDGLADPAGYCRRLRARIDTLGISGTRHYLVVEKILGHGEPCPADWGIDGTTGYDFLNQISELQHDPQGAEPLARLWHEISRRSASFEPEERDARLQVVTTQFEAALDATAQAFVLLARPSFDAADLTFAAIRRALAGLVAEMRIYRTYATGAAPYADQRFEAAVAAAETHAKGNDLLALHFVAQVISGEAEVPQPSCKDAVRRFNQLAAPVAAKAVEDTAFYRYGRLLSRNDVGCAPGHFSLSVEEFHRQAAQRAADFPSALLATATHDHKRGEDSRARLAILSELSEEWGETVASWFRQNKPQRSSALDPADEYQLYQSLVGAWPIDLQPGDDAGLTQFAERIVGWRLKSLREAKLHTSWNDPDESFEAANAQFVEAVLHPRRSAHFLSSLHGFVGRIAGAGALNSLAQCTLRCTLPGVPDQFQGSEFWDFSLVDPDNRRPVDFASRILALEEDIPLENLLAHWRDARVKQGLLARLLRLRASLHAVFEGGNYRRLATHGPRAENVLAFTRQYGGSAVLVAVPRLCATACIEANAPLPPARYWNDTTVEVQDDHAHRSWQPLLAPAITGQSNHLLCENLFARFPVAVLVSDSRV